MNLLHLIFFGPCPIFFWSRIETKQNKMFTFVFGEEPSISGSKLIVCCFLGCSLWRLSPKRERLIQLIHLRPSSPPLFICPFSAFSPYIHPSNPPPFSQPLSLSLAPLFYWPPVFLFPTATRRREDQPTPQPTPPGPAGKPETPKAHPGQERPRIALRPSWKVLFLSKYIAAPLWTKSQGSQGTRPSFRALSLCLLWAQSQTLTWTELKNSDWRKKITNMQMRKFKELRKSL